MTRLQVADLAILRSAIADLTQRVGALEQTRHTVAVSVGELRKVLEEGVHLCTNILALTRVMLEPLEETKGTDNEQS